MESWFVFAVFLCVLAVVLAWFLVPTEPYWWWEPPIPQEWNRTCGLPHVFATALKKALRRCYAASRHQILFGRLGIGFRS